jgi:hypothetical protein
MVQLFSLLVDRVHCAVELGWSREQLVTLLGLPTRTQGQKKRKVLVYEGGTSGNFWAFWFVDNCLLNFECHGLQGAADQFPTWFGDVTSLDVKLEDLVAAGFAQTSDGDVLICDGVANRKFCEALFFEDSFDRFVFGWAD